MLNATEGEDATWRRAMHIAKCAGLCALGVWAIVVGAYLVTFGFEPSGNQSRWGEFGDYVGGVLNPIVGTLTLVGIVVTVLLQRDLLQQQRRAATDEELRQQALLRETQESNTVQRLLGQHEAFDSAVFHLMAAIDRRAVEARLELGATLVSRMKTDAWSPDRSNHRNWYELKGGNLIGERAYEFLGPDVFHAILAIVSNRVEMELDDALRRDDALTAPTFRRSAVARVFDDYDYAVGPSMRQLCDVLYCCHGFQKIYDDEITPRLPALKAPTFYAQMTMNSLCAEEAQVFAIYVGAGIGGEVARAVARRYDLFSWIPLPWVREYRDLSDD
jgi:hypothetical protein